MKTIIPLTITESLVTNTTITKTYPTVVWSGATTYALNDVAYIAGSNLLRTAYKSLQASNLNHPPASSPTWWQNIGDVYPLYSGATTYAINDIVEETGTYFLYKSVIGSNTGNPLTDTAKWIKIGVSNFWSMFYPLSNQKSVCGSPLVIVLTPGQRIDSLGLVGLEANSINLKITSSAVEVYNETINLDTRETLNWYDYFFQAFTFITKIARFALPPYTNSVITITITRTQGLVKSGTLIFGTGVDLGEAQLNAENDALNFSTITRNFDGNINTLTQRRNVPKTNQITFFDKSKLNKIRNTKDYLNALPTVWSSLDDAETNYYFESFLLVGIYRRFLINSDQPDIATASIEIEEI